MSLWNDGPFIPSNVTCKDAVPINFIIIIIIIIIIWIIVNEQQRPTSNFVLNHL